MSGDLILAIDQGSSSTKALLVSDRGAVVASAGVPVSSSFPQPGWVEQSAADLVDSVRVAVAACLDGVEPGRVAAVGFSTQRESLVLWERSTGQPVAPLISWQDQRTAARCRELVEAGHAATVQTRSGLPLDPMFSATKAQWLLEAADPGRVRSQAGQLCLGTVDSYLLACFAGGEHLVEVGNASRTQLMNIRDRRWDPTLLQLFGIPPEVLGRIVASTGPFPAVSGLHPAVDGTPIAAVMGDSHAALFAHAGWQPATVKATYGTGSSVMGLCAPGDATTDGGVCLSVAWDDGTGPAYALEGNIRASGSSLSWLARAVRSTPGQLADLADTADSDGVHLVPAFNGLGAPWWDADAAGLLTGLTLGSGLPQIARATLESVAFQVEDVVAAVERQAGTIATLLADGGASGNATLMQMQADLSGRNVARALDADLSPLGAAHLAGRAAGLWTASQLAELPRARQMFTPTLDAPQRQRRQQGWRTAVARARWQPATPD